MAAIKALQQWCRQQCEGYRDVSITNMTTSFRDGLAFCAILHRHRPDLLNFDALRKENVYENNQLAFRVAEEQLGIPALLEAEDMVALKVPDRLSILTYVSQYYNYFHGRSPIGGMAGVKRPPCEAEEAPSGKKASPTPARGLPLSRSAPTPSSSRRTGARGPPAEGRRRGEQRLRGLRAARAPRAATPGGREAVPPQLLQSSGEVSAARTGLRSRDASGPTPTPVLRTRCQLCSNTLRPGAYRPTAEPGVFVCSSHRPAAAPANPMAPGRAPRPPTDSQPPSAPQTARSPRRHRHGQRLHAHRRCPSGHPLLPRPLGEPSRAQALRGPRGWQSQDARWSPAAQDTAAVSPRPAATPRAPAPLPAPQPGRAASPGPAPPAKGSAGPAPVGPAGAPAWTPAASRTQRARERFLQAPGAPSAGLAGRAPSEAERRERALSCLRKALPGLAGAQAPGRPAPATASASNGLPRAEGPRAGPPAKLPQSASPPALSPPARTEPAAPPSVGTTTRASMSPQAGRTGSAAPSGGSRAAADSRLKPEAPLAKGPSAGSQKDQVDGPAAWRGHLKPVAKKHPAERAPELMEPQVLGKPRVGAAPQKVPGSSEGGVCITLTPVRPDRTPGPAGPQPSLSAAASPAEPSPSGRRKLAVPPSLDVSGNWLQPNPPRQEALVQGQKDRRPPQDKPGRPLGPADAPASPGRTVTSPVRLHPDYLSPEEIQRQAQQIERQLDALELRGVDLEKRLRAAEGDASEDALMVDWSAHPREAAAAAAGVGADVQDQRLEEQQLDILGELRQLMAQPEGLKSPQDRQREQDLLTQYVSTVNNRSNISTSWMRTGSGGGRDAGDHDPEAGPAQEEVQVPLLQDLVPEGQEPDPRVSPWLPAGPWPGGRAGGDLGAGRAGTWALLVGSEGPQ
ncbi:hypothetical protein QTO34_016414 [Cnephaeus nilssonii]|uniref:Calponin-homology (CH) domain-containing protein n=1 Tax=Cnephaeus nilssonii TaxID=3371016 RepID=A0AA40LU16_CNENI|nr:hypothetical protein QTO34_016414 [Eptesicus nilssonii]